MSACDRRRSANTVRTRGPAHAARKGRSAAHATTRAPGQQRETMRWSGNTRGGAGGGGGVHDPDRFCLACRDAVDCSSLRFLGGAGGGGGGVVLCGGSPASGVAQAGNEERGQNVNYCPPPSTPFTACAHLLYARAPAACCRCGCLF